MYRWIVLLGLGSMLFACDTPNWESAEWVNKHLKEGDPVERRMALQKVSEMPDDLKKQIVPALLHVYDGKGSNQKEAMELLVQIRDPSAKDAFLNELKTNETGYAGAAATALGDAKITDAIPQLIEMLKTSENSDAKLGIIQALGQMPNAQTVDPLLEILKLDVDNHPIQLHANACEVLGDIALADKKALNDDAVKLVTLATFFGNKMGQSLDYDCGLAIQKIGAPAIPHLVAVFKGEREDVKKLMLKYDTPKDPFPQNTPRLISAKRLSSLRAPEATKLYISDLDQTKAAPKNLKGNPAVQWRIKEGAICSEEIRGLGDLGKKEALSMLKPVVIGEYINDEWDEITDWSVELQLRQDAAYAINQIGDRSMTKTLLEVAEKGVIIDLEKRSAMIEKSGKPVKELERYQFNWVVAGEWANLTDGADLDAFQAIIKRTEGKYKDLAKKMSSYVPVAQVALECNKGDDAAKGACYAAKLKDNKPEIRTKAAWEIGRLKPEVAGKILTENLSLDFLDTREVLTSNLYKFPSKDLVKKIDEILEKEKGSRSAEYKLDKVRLRYLRAYAANNAK